MSDNKEAKGGRAVNNIRSGKIERLIQELLALSEKSRKRGLLSLEEDIDERKALGRDVLHLGLRLVLDGWHPEYIEPVLGNIEAHERNKFVKARNKLKKAAVLAVQSGLSTSSLAVILDSCAPPHLRTPASEARLAARFSESREYFKEEREVKNG